MNNLIIEEIFAYNADVMKIIVLKLKNKIVYIVNNTHVLIVIKTVILTNKYVLNVVVCMFFVFN